MLLRHGSGGGPESGGASVSVGPGSGAGAAVVDGALLGESGGTVESGTVVEVDTGPVVDVVSVTDVVPGAGATRSNVRVLAAPLRDGDADDEQRGYPSCSYPPPCCVPVPPPWLERFESTSPPTTIDATSRYGGE